MWSLLCPETVKEDDSTIIINEENSNDGKLSRLDPSQVERIIGVGLIMMCTMEYEFKYRKQQMKVLAREIENATFQPHEAQMVYQSRYRSMI